MDGKAIATITGQDIASMFTELSHHKYASFMPQEFTLWQPTQEATGIYALYLNSNPEGVRLNWYYDIVDMNISMASSEEKGFGKFLNLGAIYCLGASRGLEKPAKEMQVNFSGFSKDGLTFYSRLFGFGRDPFGLLEFAAENGRVILFTSGGEKGKLFKYRHYRKHARMWGKRYYRGPWLTERASTYPFRQYNSGHDEQIPRETFERELRAHIQDTMSGNSKLKIDVVIPYAALFKQIGKEWGYKKPKSGVHAPVGKKAPFAQGYPEKA